MKYSHFVKLIIKKPMRMIICIHEAGHAVAAVVTGVGCESAHVTMKDIVTAGHVMIATPAPVEPQPDFAHEIVNAAGEAAVEFYRIGGSAEMMLKLGPEALKKATAAFAECGVTFNPDTDHRPTDADKLNKAAAKRGYVTPNAFQDYWKQVANRVTEMVDLHWDAILSAAEELYLHSHISGARVEEIVGECSRRPPKRKCEMPSVQYLRSQKRKMRRESMSLAC